jgi:hypothetical protein
MSDRAAMIMALKGTVEPHLRSAAFSGSFPHYRRIREDRIDLVTVQFEGMEAGSLSRARTMPALLQSWIFWSAS